MIEEIKNDSTDENADEEIDGHIEYTTREDYITCSYFAISSVSDMDLGMMNKEDAKRIKRIIRKSLRIIDECVNEMHDELFETDDDDN